MLFPSLRPRDNRSAINVVAVAQHSDPMKNHALVLGKELAIEELRRKYEDVCLVLAFSGCVNLAVIIWFLVQAAKAVVSF
jgi:hypothetical protein